MMRQFCLFFTLFVLVGFSFTGFTFADGAKPAVVVLPDISKPHFIYVDGGQIIITEGPFIYLYSLKDFRLQKKFGKQGEGPEEFKIGSFGGGGLFVSPQPDLLLVNSVGKLSFFTRKGEYIKEMKIPQNMLSSLFTVLGKNFVGRGSKQVEGKGYITLNIHDAELKPIKEVYKWENPHRQGKGTRTFNDPVIFQVDDGKIFASKGKGITIEVFDSKGENLYTIDHKYEKLKPSDDLKNEVIKFYKTNPATAQVYQYLQPIIFPDYLPGTATFLVKGKKIYLITHKREGDKTELLVMDLKGKILKHMMLSMAKQNALQFYPFTFMDGKLYQLVENEKTENWELHISNVI